MSKSPIDSLFGHIEADRAQQYDPVSFAYVESLAGRLQQPLYASNSVLKEKLNRNIQTFIKNFDAANKQASLGLNHIAAEFPDHENQAIRYFEQGQFKQLKSLQLKLNKATNASQGNSLLNELNSKIQKQVIEPNAANKASSFDQILNRQERDLAAVSGQSVEPKKISEEPLELESMKVFRESVKYFNIDKILDRAINEHPENPGPHNPHMLAVKSLTQMRELSPQYCRRFGGYIETLLWLEKNAARLDPTKTY